MFKNGGLKGGQLLAEWPVSWCRNRWSVAIGMAGQLVPEYAQAGDFLVPLKIRRRPLQ